MERLKRIEELKTQKAAIESELKTLSEQVAAESAALKKSRKPRQRKEQQIV